MAQSPDNCVKSQPQGVAVRAVLVGPAEASVVHGWPAAWHVSSSSRRAALAHTGTTGVLTAATGRMASAWVPLSSACWVTCAQASSEMPCNQRPHQDCDGGPLNVTLGLSQEMGWSRLRQSAVVPASLLERPWACGAGRPHEGSLKGLLPRTCTECEARVPEQGGRGQP